MKFCSWWPSSLTDWKLASFEHSKIWRSEKMDTKTIRNKEKLEMWGIHQILIESMKKSNQWYLLDSQIFLKKTFYFQLNVEKTQCWNNIFFLIKKNHFLLCLLCALRNAIHFLPCQSIMYLKLFKAILFSKSKAVFHESIKKQVKMVDKNEEDFTITAIQVK